MKTCNTTPEKTPEIESVADSDKPIPQADFEDFIRASRIRLVEGDLIALMAIGQGYEAGMNPTAGTILDILKEFNPSRA